MNHSEKRNQELLRQITRLQSDNEDLNAKLAKQKEESQNHIYQLKEEVDKLRAENEKYGNYIRDLEQSNDDLERAKRALDASLSDFEGRLNEQIEKNVILESEIGEKEQLQVVVQRLKDEARDLRQELMVQKEGKRASLIPHKLPLDLTQSPNDVKITSNNQINKMRSNSVAVAETQTNGTPIKQTRLNFSRSTSNPVTPSTGQQPGQQPGQPPLPLLSPSTRISALNIVSDLLRKVGALESKLASCRNLYVGTPSSNRNGSNNNTNNNKSNPTTPIQSPIKDINAN